MGFGRLIFVALVACFGALGQTCTFTFTPASVSVAATTNPLFQGSFNVTASNSSCRRTPVSNVDWLVIQLGQTGTGNGLVGYAVENNLTPTTRVGTITIGNATFTVTQAANACPTTLTLQGGNGVPAEGASRPLTVATNCQWTATTNVDWITLGPPSNGTGAGAVLVNVARNTTSRARSGVVTVGSQSVVINQAGANCSYALSPFSLQATSAGGSFSAALTASCEWTASSSQPWVTVSPSSGAASANLSITVAANASSADARSANVAVGSANLAVTQTGASCSLSFAPASVTGVPAVGATGEITVTTACSSWTAVSGSPWLRVTQTGNRVTYTVDPNPAAQARSATITAGAATFGLTQAGATCSYEVSRETVEIPAEGGSGSLSVTTTAGCTWSPVPDAAWLRISGVVSGSTSGSLSYAADANPSATARSANLAIASKIVRFTQAAAANAPRVAANAVVSAASYAGGGVSPGEIVTIFGQNLGPASLVGLALDADGATVAKELAGTRVLFDGIASAMVYTSAGQVSAVVPYGIAGRAAVTLQTEYQGVRSNAVSLPVLATKPALFTADSSGTGAAAALNQDGSVNGAANGAVAGSIVILFGTGAGLTEPVPVDGAVIAGAPLPRPLANVRVTVGGREAEVLYAGAAPGLVAGVWQINVRVPVGVGTGATPVVVQAGEGVSGDRVTVAVR